MNMPLKLAQKIKNPSTFADFFYVNLLIFKSTEKNSSGKTLFEYISLLQGKNDAKRRY